MNFLSHINNKSNIEIIDEVENKIRIKELKEIINFNSFIMNQLNIKASDTVAIVLENGPKFITSFLSVINVCISAPLNPSYSLGEFSFYYKDLKPKALVTDLNETHPAIIIAKKINIKILVLEKFFFQTEYKRSKTKKNKLILSNMKDFALILHTSGTTSRPKMVALSHTNLLCSAKNISNTLKITNKDKNIILMPSFHIHGIVASILAPLYRGAKVVALPKFNVLTFYKSLALHQPTWFTAVPTMLQSILDRAKNNRKVINNNKLRFIRSSSASLPISVLQELEKVFKIPVIESYGMTEAAHQMTSNPLPPFKRKAGSVGVATGLRVKVVGTNISFLSAEKEGEVIIKGNNVLKKYLANPKANKSSFFKGWFRTGDLGYFDKEGYLYITGRIKEIINRGGEKISPKEVDEVFIKHPKVAKVVTFSIKHPKLGEDIALAVVLKTKKNCTQTELKDFAKKKLANFKIPRNIYFLKEIPVGATGKLQRIGLAKKLGIEK